MYASAPLGLASLPLLTLPPALDQQLLHDVFELLFGTHALYQDRPSRIAVQKCLVSAIHAGASPETIGIVVKALRRETQKPAIAIANAFVMAEWCGIIMQHLAVSPLWEPLASDVLLAGADALEKCLQPHSKGGVARSALVVTRRGLRKLFALPQSRNKNLHLAVSHLTGKGQQPVARHSLMLGVIAAVCARQPELRSQLETHKPKYYDFYLREVIGSRTALPVHVASGLGDFFLHFVTLDELDKVLIPAIDKALLRAPEIVLGGLLKLLVTSLPESMDLSEVLRGKLLKPLLSNVKSSNPGIRAGAISVFRAIVARCFDLQVMDGVVNEVASPLTAGKLASPDQRVIHAEMLQATPLSDESAIKTCSALVAVASKEGNEAALAAETSALARSIAMILEGGEELSKAVLDAVVKGLAEKKPGLRRLWLLRVGSILQGLGRHESTSGGTAFAEAVMPELIANSEQAAANAAAAAQSGLLVGAHVLTALTPSMLQQFPGCTFSTSLTKSAASAQASLLSSKHALLLNHRVYGKISTEQDLYWFCRALVSIAPQVVETTDKDVALAWSDAMIHLITASTVPPKMQLEAAKSLSKLYAHNPMVISQILVKGLWNSLARDEAKDKDVKLERANLINVLRSFCLDPGELRELGFDIHEEVLQAQACTILVLARRELIPRSSWIDLCLRMSVDPGSLARSHLSELFEEIGRRTSLDHPVCSLGTDWSLFYEADAKEP